MGTRNLICIHKDGVYKVAQYGQWDGYPGGQGIGVLRFLKNNLDKDLFFKKLNNISYISEEEWCSRWFEFGVDINGGDGFISCDISDKFYAKYPEMSRDTSSDIFLMIQNSSKDLKLRDSINFAGDSLFCEWAYVVDFDKNTFEVYEGFNKNSLSENERFYGFKQNNTNYYPVKLAISFDINNLPTEEEFLNTFNNDEE